MSMTRTLQGPNPQEYSGSAFRSLLLEDEQKKIKPITVEVRQGKNRRWRFWIKVGEKTALGPPDPQGHLTKDEAMEAALLAIEQLQAPRTLERDAAWQGMKSARGQSQIDHQRVDKANEEKKQAEGQLAVLREGHGHALYEAEFGGLKKGYFRGLGIGLGLAFLIFVAWLLEHGFGN